MRPAPFLCYYIRVNFSFDFITVVVLLAALANASLGFFVLLTDRKEKVNQFFFVFSLTVVLWEVAFIFYHGLAATLLALSFARILYASGAIIPFAFIFFLYFFPQEKYNFPQRVYGFLCIPFALVVLASILPHGLITDVFALTQQTSVVNFRTGYEIVYALYILAYFSVAFTLVWMKHESFSGSKKAQIRWLGWGLGFSALVILLTTIFAPLLGTFALFGLGPASLVVVIGLIGQMILKETSYDTRLTMGRFVVSIVSAAAGLRILFSSTGLSVLLNIIFLAAILYIGRLLLRNIQGQVHQDNTHQREVASLKDEIEKIHASMGHLEKSLEKAGRDVLDATDHFEKLAEKKDQFLAFALRQIHKPLATISGQTGFIADGHFGEVGEAVKGVLNTVTLSSSHGISTVQKFLDAILLKPAKNHESATDMTDATDFDVRTLAKEVLTEYEQRIERVGLKVNFVADQKECMVNGEREHIRQVIRNLLDNAIRHSPSETPDGGIGWIVLEVAHEGRKVTISVTDKGVGLSKGDASKLFQRFAQSGGLDDDGVIGMGLGLYVSAVIVEAHRGKIWAESLGLGKGTTFFVQLPVVKK